jgi:RHS repeat-associated protein
MSTTIIAPLADRARRWHPWATTRRWLGTGLTLALVMLGVQAVTSGPALAASTASGTAPVSNAFAMGGGVGGSIDQRTGAFQAQLPLVSIAGRAGTGLSLTLSYDQSLAVQGPAGDRFGLGAGWTLGVPWVNTAGGVQVYPASGGSYAYDTGSPTGLAQYPLRDLAFVRESGQLPDGRSYVYKLTYLGGQTVSYFDTNGNLIEQTDRFGNTIGLTWGQSGSSWHPLAVTDNYGQVTRFDYGTPGQVKVVAPVNAEGVTATTTLTFYGGYLQTVTDPMKQKTTFGYTQLGGLSAQLLSSVAAPTGEDTAVTYIQPPYEKAVVVASDVKVTDANSRQVLTERHFSLDGTDDKSQHNYTGYPQYNAKGPNALFTSNDAGYQYTTELSDSSSAVEFTYNSLHLLISQKVLTASGPGGLKTSQTQVYCYPVYCPPKMTSWTSLPANYAKPTSVAVTYGDPSHKSNRTVTTSSAYNDEGLQTSATNAAGTTTATTYNSYGLPVTQTVTGTDGSTSITTDTFTADGKSVQTVSTATGPSANAATARTVATYSYNGYGQVTGESLAWAPGAKPKDDSDGPDQVDTSQQISFDTAAHTQTDVFTTAAGTPDAASTKTVTDLVTGNVLSRTTPGNAIGTDLTTSYTYDALGRQLTSTAPSGQVTTTFHDSPTVTTVTAPSGLKTQTTTDALGRTVKVTDNVSGQKLVASPTARTVQTDHYASDGSEKTTTTPAGTATTTFDPLGRPAQVVQPSGITETESYNDVANTTQVSVVPSGPGTPAPVSVTTSSFDDLNQPLTSSVSYTDHTPAAPAGETYDKLGRVSSYSGDDVTATPDYGGAGGLQDGTKLTPGDPTDYPGQTAQAATDNTLTGALSTKTLTDQTKAAGTTYSYDTAGRVHTATTADGAVSTYTYTPAGQIASVTQPSGTSTTYTYDGKTGQLTEVDVQGAGGTTQKTGYHYDPATGQVTSVYNPADPADAIGYKYDADGHVIEVDYPDGTSTKASYADNGQLATTTDTTGAVTTYAYNTDGTCGPAHTDLCQAVQVRGSTRLATVSYTYDSMDRVHTITRGNKVTTTLDYTDASQVKTETTTAADGSVLRTDGYTYDSHSNVATHTITTALPAPAAPAPTSSATTQSTKPSPKPKPKPTKPTPKPTRPTPKPTRSQPLGAPASSTITAYGYDAYNRLISSKVYSGIAATGTPTSSTAYTVDAAGNVTAQDTTTSAGTTHTASTITPGGELTGRTGAAATQKFDADGNVTTDLAGNTYTWDPDGEQASVTTRAGVTTSYTYWPDHTRSTATTTTGGVGHTITYHYATDGKIADETYAGGGSAVTATYLLGVNREARTLDTAAGAAQDTGAGTGYYLTDAHGSVTTMIDASGAVTASYAYGDYGQPDGASPALLATPAADPAGNAAINPFTYDGAYTNPTTGTQYLPARTYDPDQGRFLTADAADQFNRYQAFDTNPIVDTDPTGQWALPQIVTDLFATLVFIATAVASAGAAIPVYAAVAAGEAIADAAITATVLNTVAVATNLGAAATSATLTANDAAELTGHGFLSSDQVNGLNAATFTLGTIGGFSSALPGFPGFSSEAADSAAAVTSTVKDSEEIGTDASKALSDEGETQSESTSVLSDGDEESVNSSSSDSEQDPALGDLFDEVPDYTGPSGWLSTSRATPQTLERTTDDFIAEQEQFGLNQNKQLDQAQTFREAQQVPGGPKVTSTNIVPVTTGPASTANAALSPSPLGDVAAAGVKGTNDDNAPLATPSNPSNPLDENVSPSAIGISQQQVLSSDEGISIYGPF